MTIYIPPHTKESLEEDERERLTGHERQETEYWRRYKIHHRCQKIATVDIGALV